MFLFNMIGIGQFNLKKNMLLTGFGGMYDKGENLLAAQIGIDSNVRSIMSTSHEFTQSKLL
jgi:hypothetical protein